jgi:hypothetical protein
MAPMLPAASGSIRRMIGRRRIAFAATLVTLTLAIGACGDADVPAPARPSSAFGAGAAASTTPPPPSAVDTGDTDGDAPGANQETGSGASQARLELRGDLDEDLRLTAESPSILDPPPGGIGVTWSDASLSNRFVIAGLSFTGTRDTDPTTIVTLLVSIDGRPLLFLSNAGECALTIDALSDTAMRGSVRCRKLKAKAGGETIDLAGTFAVGD